ncbi:hypothetical protein [Thalassotalea maritima]|uniref:hypothetical protein n=1 Tax=Thalassotalea maritima TaxID=3242416 RepID=UPI003529BE6D
MTASVEQHLIDNISQLLKRSLVADSALQELRSNNKAKFSALFPEQTAFKVKADTFQPYIQELADELLVWQQNKDNQLLASMVKKIELLYDLLAKLEGHYQH